MTHPSTRHHGPGVGENAVENTTASAKSEPTPVHPFLALAMTLTRLLATILALVSVFSPWLDVTTPPGTWSVSPIYFFGPVRDIPITEQGTVLLNRLGWSANYSLRLGTLALLGGGLAYLITHFKTKSLTQRLSIRAYVEAFTPPVLVILSCLIWVVYVAQSIGSTCFDSSCLTGLSGIWEAPSGIVAQWTPQMGFFTALVAGGLMLLASFLEIDSQRVSSQHEQLRIAQ